jgi:hypothetical protein
LSACGGFPRLRCNGGNPQKQPPNTSGSFADVFSADLSAEALAFAKAEGRHPLSLCHPRFISQLHLPLRRSRPFLSAFICVHPRPIALLQLLFGRRP